MKPRILLAEDDVDLREALRRRLGERWEVEAVPDGAAALEAARVRPPDLVLTDLAMPRLDGLGLLRALRAEEGTRAVPVVLLTGRVGDEGRLAGLRAGADDVLLKPLGAGEIMSRLGAQLAVARARRAASRTSRRAPPPDRAMGGTGDAAWIAALGHELRNPLAPLVTAVELARLRGEAPDPAVVERQVTRLARVVETLLGSAVPAHDRDVGREPPARVLIVDDDRDAGPLLADALRLRGHHVRVAFDGGDALVQAREFVPEIALLDLGLPSMDGLELAARLRSLLPGRVRLVAFTGHGLPFDLERTRRAGFDDHLVKPVAVEVVGRVMARLLTPSVAG